MAQMVSGDTELLLQKRVEWQSKEIQRLNAKADKYKRLYKKLLKQYNTQQQEQQEQQQQQQQHNTVQQQTHTPREASTTTDDDENDDGNDSDFDEENESSETEDQDDEAVQPVVAKIPTLLLSALAPEVVVQPSTSADKEKKNIPSSSKEVSMAEAISSAKLLLERSGGVGRRGSAAFFAMLAAGQQNLSEPPSSSSLASSSLASTLAAADELDTLLNQALFSPRGTYRGSQQSVDDSVLSGPITPRSRVIHNHGDALLTQAASAASGSVSQQPQCPPSPSYKEDWLAAHSFDELDAFRARQQYAREVRVAATATPQNRIAVSGPTLLLHAKAAEGNRQRRRSQGATDPTTRPRYALRRATSDDVASTHHQAPDSEELETIAQRLKEPLPPSRLSLDDQKVSYRRADIPQETIRNSRETKLKRLSLALFPAKDVATAGSKRNTLSGQDFISQQQEACLSPPKQRRSTSRPVSPSKRSLSSSLRTPSVSPSDVTPKPGASIRFKETRRNMAEMPVMSQGERLKQELIDTEETYVNGLKTLMLIEEIARDERLVDADDLKALFFQGVNVMIGLHETFIDDLKKVGQPIQKTLCAFIPTLKVYSMYYLHHVKGMRMMKKCVQSPQFQELLKRAAEQKILATVCSDDDDFEHSPRNPIPIHFESIYILPIQRLPRYEMLMQGLAKHAESDEERSIFEKLKADMESINKQLNEELIREENIARMSDIQAMIGASKHKLGYAFNIWDKTRTLEYEGKMLVKGKGRSVRGGGALSASPLTASSITPGGGDSVFNVAEQFFLFDDIVLNVVQNDKGEQKFKRLFHIEQNAVAIKTAIQKDFENGMVLTDSNENDVEVRFQPITRPHWLAAFKKVLSSNTSA